MIELSTQDALLADLFPRAKSVWWENGYPIIIDCDDPYSTGFKGFFTKEELVGLVRHAEYPQRVSPGLLHQVIPLSTVLRSAVTLTHTSRLLVSNVYNELTSA